MVKIIDFKLSKIAEGKEFVSLKLQGGVEYKLACVLILFSFHTIK